MDTRLQTEEFLGKNNVDTTILKRAKDGSVELQDLPALRRGLDILNGFQTHPVDSSRISKFFSKLIYFFAARNFL